MPRYAYETATKILGPSALVKRECNLNQIVQEMEFIEHNFKCVDFQSRAEKFARKLVRKFKEEERRASASSSVVLDEEIESDKNGSPVSVDVQEISGPP